MIFYNAISPNTIRGHMRSQYVIHIQFIKSLPEIDLQRGQYKFYAKF